MNRESAVKPKVILFFETHTIQIREYTMSWDWEKLKRQQQGGGSVPPQMDEFVDKIKKVKLPGGPFLILIILAVIFFGSSTFYTIGVDEVGVVQRFGKFVRISQPGLNFKLPAGIEKVTKVKVFRQKEE